MHREEAAIGVEAALNASSYRDRFYANVRVGFDLYASNRAALRMPHRLLRQGYHVALASISTQPISLRSACSPTIARFPFTFNGPACAWNTPSERRI